MKDILIFMSDQHRAALMGHRGDTLVATPCLDQLAKDGTRFDNAVTASPLCVPARMSFLTGLLPSQLTIFGNDEAMMEEQATFLHSLAVAGYETVLCGRMHFKGENQSHGFTRRIAPDITPQFWGTGGELRTDLGDFKGSLAEKGCLKIVGGGNSPVLEYDRHVVNCAIEYLQQDHDRPQCIVVGVYSPHFTYVAPPELYNKYYRLLQDDFVELPASSGLPMFAASEASFDRELLIKTNAAYLGMIEYMDGLLGEVRTAWDSYLQRRERQGMFAYLSDHGDHTGNRRLFGKKTFFEQSVKIPMIVQGDGIRKNQVKHGAVSIMDMAPTLIDYAGATVLPQTDGQSLLPGLQSDQDDLNRTVFSEVMLDVDGEKTFGRMGLRGTLKYFSYSGFEQEYFYNLDADPHELHNLKPETMNDFYTVKQATVGGLDVTAILAQYHRRTQGIPLLTAFGRSQAMAEPARYVVPEHARCGAGLVSAQ